MIVTVYQHLLSLTFLEDHSWSELVLFYLHKETTCVNLPAAIHVFICLYSGPFFVMCLFTCTCVYLPVNVFIYLYTFIYLYMHLFTCTVNLSLSKSFHDYFFWLLVLFFKNKKQNKIVKKKQQINLCEEKQIYGLAVWVGMNINFEILCYCIILYISSTL